MTNENTFKEYMEYLKNFHVEGFEIQEVKAQDYAGKENPLRNFEDAARLAGITTEQGLMVRMGDKIARTRQLIETGSYNGKVGESLRDTLMDLANYAGILSYICAKKLGDVPVPDEDEAPEGDFAMTDGLPVEVGNKIEPNWFSKMIGLK